MKLFVITSRIPYPLEKGDKLSIFYQMKGLSKEYQIYLCALHFSNKKENQLAYEVLNNFCKEVHFIKLSPIQIGISLFKSLFSGIPFQTALFTDVKAKTKVRDLINSIAPNHIYCQLTRAAEYVRTENRTKTLDYMDAFSKGMERRAKNTNLLTRWIYSWEASKQKRYEKEIFSSFDSHCIITEEDQSYIDTSRKKEIKIIRNGVDLNHFLPQQTPIKYDIVFVGNMGYAPNIDAAEFLCNDILPLIKKEIPTVKILLAGAEPSLTVQNLKSESVEVSGWLKDIRTAYSESTIFIAPMRIGTGLQNKLLEAMAMKIACVTTPLANKALRAPENSIRIGFTAQELADECIFLLNNKEQNNRQAELGNKFVKDNYQWSKTTDELTKLFSL